MLRVRSRFLFHATLAIAMAGFLCLATPDVSAQFRGIQMNMNGGGTSISVSNVNGVKTTKVNDQGKKYEIIESEEEGIKVKFSKVYGPKDREKLKEDFPDLFMHLASFPTETEGATVELNISIVKEQQAQNAEALEKDHPEAFAIYKKYSRQGGGFGVGGAGAIGGFGGEIRIEGFPREFKGRIPRIKIEDGVPRIEIEPAEPKAVPKAAEDDVDI